VLFLLTPLYEELRLEQETEENWKTDLRSLSKRFLCHAGYKPCIEEAEEAFRIWQHTVNPNYENPLVYLQMFVGKFLKTCSGSSKI